MSAVPSLLARRVKLLEQLESNSSDGARDEIERQLAQIDTALELLGWLSTNEDPKEP
jgi:C4-dicarboxylate-specific signal transduction histidine kinase